MICQPARVRLHLPDYGAIGGEKFWRRGGITDEVAEVDTGYKRRAIRAGEWSSAAVAKIGLQPF